MTLGIGTDIIEIERIKKALDKQTAFVNTVFTTQEQRYCMQFSEPERPFAARFCAKEAVAKAMGEGINDKLSWLDIEISHTKKGQPVVSLSPSAQKKLDTEGIFLISLSHCKAYATATAIWLA
ncbi:MAG: holo-[acyl-carrier-protein] synthase [Chlamydiales bacterium]|nr:holo-ACP synthase [Chlamydiales bacterium]NCF70920.1 holo-[acyl-carrier-protein] synthase [Chlamydiales bacterium]